jgi:hypothetical protein
VYELKPGARTELQRETSAPLTPRPLLSCLTQESWCAQELATLDLGDVRLKRRAVGVLQARWANPQESFYGSFGTWTEAMGAYRLIENETAAVTLDQLLGAHSQATQARMAAESLVLLPQDTSTLNYTGLKRTTGLGPLGEDKGQGLWLHSQLAYRPDGIPLGVLNARCWARPKGKAELERGRNAQSIDEKESERWVESLAWPTRPPTHDSGQLVASPAARATCTNCDAVPGGPSISLSQCALNITAARIHQTLVLRGTQPVARTCPGVPVAAVSGQPPPELRYARSLFKRLRSAAGRPAVGGLDSEPTRPPRTAGLDAVDRSAHRQRRPGL